VRRTHRVLGVSSLLFVVLISISGLILNHADALGLSRHAVGPSLLSLYGIEAPPVDTAFAAGGVLFATAADTLYANGFPLAQSVHELIGAVALQSEIVIATRDELFVTSPDALLIERFAPDAAGDMRELGTDGRRIVAVVADGYAEFDAERMILATAEIATPEGISWSRPATPSAAQAEQIGVAALGQVINWERLLLDLHSGRILPGVGRYLADITALALLYMCFSGIVLWTRRR
jgi:hypothetical protein